MRFILLPRLDAALVVDRAFVGNLPSILLKVFLDHHRLAMVET